MIDKLVLALQDLRRSRLWISIFRQSQLPQTQADYLAMNRRNFFVHVLPAQMKRKSLRTSYSWLWMGVVSWWLFILLTLSGLFLMFYYEPSVERAYDSIVRIMNQVTLGRFMRNFHKWGGELMVITVFLHMLRVFYTGTYQKPREFNWIIGVVLFLITIFFAFSGYILPWDQLGFFATTIAGNIARGVPFIGPQVQYALLGVHDVKNLSQAALSRWYVIHVFLLPTLIVLLISIHFWRIRKDEFSAPPEDKER
jgi:quinol-cytochrome oxidoreductase complex cytochrome b subunit